MSATRPSSSPILPRARQCRWTLPSIPFWETMSGRSGSPALPHASFMSGSGVDMMRYDRDSLNRGAKILVDLQLASSWEEAYAMLGRYRFAISVGGDAVQTEIGRA